jgi:hypothetical protein
VKAELKAPDEFVTSLEGKSLEELNTIQNQLTKERMTTKAKARAVAKLRHQLSSEEDAGAHGLNVEEYKEVKRIAKEQNISLAKAIVQVRKGVAKQRALQSATTKQVELNTQVKGA